MKNQIVLSGIGGQGLISTGEIMGQAASIFEENMYATMTASYGSETRGTFTKTDVIISDEPIGYPNVDVPDVILCLAQVAYDRYVGKFTDNTKVFYDTEMVTPREGAKGQHIGCDFRAMSIELGNVQTANTIALGVMLKDCALHAEPVKKAIAARFEGKNKVIGINWKALDHGLNLHV
ncbi:hypothetical protein CE91St46_27700 [Eubacteriales bacterium]|nr:2-oxoacid:acceptor oxidoreductase family protein [Faecalicatena sp. BF-R-105]GKH51659.1 hypothetical protein CE91St46_27700 [Eubacteriales bacterium]GKH64378.1 hypothetical protein CE91St47_28470 [Eubacteriales bacterium]